MNDDSIARFLAHHRKDFARISRATRGESSPGDVENEAWLLIADLAAKGREWDLTRPADQHDVLRYLYQHLVRYTELNVRNAVRLDHSPGGEEGEMHPLAHLLAGDELCDPLLALVHLEDKREIDSLAQIGPHQSLAAAYLCLLDQLGNHMAALADHLLISLSYCYQRCRHARTLAVHQQPLPATAMPKDPAFVPGAWRRWRLMREPVQLCLDFDWHEALFTAQD